MSEASEFDSTSLTTPVFCFGSNSTKQLRERCKNADLESVQCKLPGYRRFFAGNSKKWGGGGVASIAERHGSECRGTFVRLTENELALLDRHEGIPADASPFDRDPKINHYRREWITIVSESEELKAIAYIRNDNMWEGMPSAKYLQACWANLNPFWETMDEESGELLIYDGKGQLQGSYVGASHDPADFASGKLKVTESKTDDGSVSHPPKVGCGTAVS